MSPFFDLDSHSSGTETTSTFSSSAKTVEAIRSVERSSSFILRSVFFLVQCQNGRWRRGRSEGGLNEADQMYGSLKQIALNTHRPNERAGRWRGAKEPSTITRRHVDSPKRGPGRQTAVHFIRCHLPQNFSKTHEFL